MSTPSLFSPVNPIWANPFPRAQASRTGRSAPAARASEARACSSGWRAGGVRQSRGIQRERPRPWHQTRHRRHGALPWSGQSDPAALQPGPEPVCEPFNVRRVAERRAGPKPRAVIVEFRSPVHRAPGVWRGRLVREGRLAWAGIDITQAPAMPAGGRISHPAGLRRELHPPRSPLADLPAVKPVRPRDSSGTGSTPAGLLRDSCVDPYPATYAHFNLCLIRSEITSTNSTSAPDSACPGPAATRRYPNSLTPSATR